MSAFAFRFTPRLHLAAVGAVCCALAGAFLTTATAEPLKILHQGTERAAELYRPSAAPPGPLPLVIALHGLGSSGARLRRNLRLDATADRGHFAVVYPDAVDARWSYGRPTVGPMPTIGDVTVDDIGFIGTLIDTLVSRKIADPARIYVTGSSRGGLMTFTLACALADLIAAAAPLITGMTNHQRDDCKPARPVPLMVVAGTADRIQAFGGAKAPQGELLAVRETVNFWRKLHGCGQADARPLPRRQPDDPTRVMLVEWNNCASGAQLRLYRIIGGGHQTPSIASAVNPDVDKRFGRRNRDFETADELWAFFKNYRR